MYLLTGSHKCSSKQAFKAQSILRLSVTSFPSSVESAAQFRRRCVFNSVRARENVETEESMLWCTVLCSSQRRLHKERYKAASPSLVLNFAHNGSFSSSILPSKCPDTTRAVNEVYPGLTVCCCASSSCCACVFLFCFWLKQQAQQCCHQVDKLISKKKSKCNSGCVFSVYCADLVFKKLFCHNWCTHNLWHASKPMYTLGFKCLHWHQAPQRTCCVCLSLMLLCVTAEPSVFSLLSIVSALLAFSSPLAACVLASRAGRRAERAIVLLYSFVSPKDLPLLPHLTSHLRGMRTMQCPGWTWLPRCFAPCFSPALWGKLPLPDQNPWLLQNL